MTDKLTTVDSQLDARQRIGLPEHFCTQTVCEYNIRPLAAETQKQNGRRGKLWVKRSRSGKDEVWSLTQEKNNWFTLRDAGASTATIEVRVHLHDLQRVSTREGAYVEYRYGENDSVCFFKKIDLQAFLNTVTR